MSSECFERGQYPISPISVGARFLSGYAFKSQDFGEVGFPVVKIKNIQNRLVSLDDSQCVPKTLITEKLAKFVLKNGDVLIAMTGQGSVGRVGRLQCASHLFPLMNQRVGKFLADETSLNKDYLYYVISSDVFEKKLFAMGSGSGQPNLSPEVILSVEIPFPPYFKQVAIAETLNALDDRITLLRETNATLEAIAQALFKSWFVDFDPVRAKMEGRAPEGMDEATAALFPDGFEDSALGLVPRGWRASTMGEVSTVGIGKTPPRKEPQWFSESPEDMRWVSIRDMGASGVFASRTSEFLTEESIQRFNVRVVPDNTTLLSFKMTIGRVAITDGEMTTNEAIAHFKLGPESSLTSEFIYLHLKQFNFSSLSSTSSIADAVNSKTVKNIPILVPDAAALDVFRNQAGSLFQRIKVIERQAQTLATLRDTLLPRLISGQLRLPEARHLMEDAA